MKSKARVAAFGPIFGAIVASITILWPNREWAMAFCFLCIVMWLLVVFYYNKKKRKADAGNSLL